MHHLLPNRPQLERFIVHYLESLEIERGASPYTLRNYRFYLTRFAGWFTQIAKRDDLAELTLELVLQYRLFLARYSDTKGRTLSRVTQSYHIIALRSFLKWLTKHDHQVLAPEKIDLPKAQSRSLKFLSGTQVERLLSQPTISTTRGLRDKAILEVLFSTGLRVSELVALDRDKVDLGQREFGVIGKGGRPRVVFLSERSAGWLARYLKTRNDHWKPLFIRYSPATALPTTAGETMRLSARSIQRIVERYRERAELVVRITPHGLRHTFATDLLHAGAGLREVQEMLGHKNIATTQIYTHVTNPQLRKVHQRYHGRRR